MNFTLERELRDYLKIAEKEIRSNLNDCPKEDSTREAIVKILKILGQQVFHASLIYNKWKKTDGYKPRTFEFSFFPGYVDKLQERITPEIEFNSEMIYSDVRFDYQGDLSDIQKINHTPKEICSLLAVAHRELLYDPKKFDHPITGEKTSNIFIGGTHEWASSVIDDILLGDSQYRMDIIAFFKNHARARKSQTLNPTWMAVPFEVNDDSVQSVYKWCEAMVNEFASYHPEIKWPFDFYHNSVSINSSEGRLIHIIRAFLVGLWLKLLFFSNELGSLLDSVWWKFLDEIDMSPLLSSFNRQSYDGEKEYKYYQAQLEDVKLRIQHLKKVLSSQRADMRVNEPYDFWYTLPFKKAPNFFIDEAADQIKIKDPDRVGSVMILTNYSLGQTFFRIVSPWIEDRIYGMLKDFETTREIYQKRDAEWKIVLRQLRHNLLTHFRIVSNIDKIEVIRQLNKDMEEIIRLTKYLESDKDMKEYVDDQPKRKVFLKQDIVEKLIHGIIESINNIPESWPIRKSVIDALQANSFTLIEYQGQDWEIEFETVDWLARLIVKDVLTNAIKNVNKSNPRVIIKAERRDEDNITLFIENNNAIDEDWITIYNSDKNILPKKPDEIGIYIIKRYSKHLGWKIFCETYESENEEKYTSISIRIPIL